MPRSDTQQLRPVASRSVTVNHRLSQQLISKYVASIRLVTPVTDKLRVNSKLEMRDRAYSVARAA